MSFPLHFRFHVLMVHSLPSGGPGDQGDVANAKGAMASGAQG